MRHRPGPLPGSETGLFTLRDEPGVPGADVPALAVSYYFHRVYNKSSVGALNICVHVQCLSVNIHGCSA